MRGAADIPASDDQATAVRRLVDMLPSAQPPAPVDVVVAWVGGTVHHLQYEGIVDALFPRSVTTKRLIVAAPLVRVAYEIDRLQLPAGIGDHTSVAPS